MDDQIMVERPDVRSLHFNRESALADAELARARAIPDPTFTITYTHDNLTIAGNQPNSLTFDVGIPLPIFDTGRHDADKAAARARELEETQRATLVDARADVATLRDHQHWLEVSIQQLTSDSIPRSQAINTATRKAFDSQHIALGELLLAERTHRELVIKLLDLKFDLFTTRNQLRQVLGLDGALARNKGRGRS
jgi:cobalt-zinc-cadmium efflux system outer membrane protein